MHDPALAAELTRVLDGLTDDQRREVLDFARTVGLDNGAATPSHPSGRPRGTPGRDLLKFAGILTPEEGAEMLRVIEEDCGRVNPDDWK
jgi:hypothetical protein